MPRRSVALDQWGVTDNLASGKFQFHKGEILFGKLRPYFHKVGVAPVDGVCSTDILVITPNEPAWFAFLLGHVSSDELIRYTDGSSAGTRMPRTSWSDLARYRVSLPPQPVAAAFDRQIRPLIQRIVLNVHEANTLVELRDTLLPRLLSGELRVPEAAYLAEASL
jgi:type I restriction enzyme S subunit